MTRESKKTKFNATKILSQEKLLKLFDYDSETGCLIWVNRPIEHFAGERHFKAWNTRHAGKLAGAFGVDGYTSVLIRKERFLAHRIIWVHQYGDVDDFHLFEIDHINRDRSNNRLNNLRLVTTEINLKNHPRRKDNTSGVTGVGWSKYKRMWFARINYDRKDKFLGYFQTIEAATSARIDAANKHGYHPNHGQQR